MNHAREYYTHTVLGARATTRLLHPVRVASTGLYVTIAVCFLRESALTLGPLTLEVLGMMISPVPRLTARISARQGGRRRCYFAIEVDCIPRRDTTIAPSGNNGTNRHKYTLYL